MTPPVGLTSSPINPRPIPLKKPSTPFRLAPERGIETFK